MIVLFIYISAIYVYTNFICFNC